MMSRYLLSCLVVLSGIGGSAYAADHRVEALKEAAPKAAVKKAAPKKAAAKTEA